MFFEFRLIVCFTAPLPVAHPLFPVARVSRTLSSALVGRNTLLLQMKPLDPLNTTWVHLELSDTHDTFILSLKHLKQKIMKVYCHTFYITDKFFFRTIEITMKTLKLPKQYVHRTFVCSFKIVYSFIPTLGKSLCIFFGKKRSGLLQTLRVNCFPYYTTIKGHTRFLTNAFCRKKKKSK